MTHEGIRIRGNGMADSDGDLVWITIETPHTEFQVQFLAIKARELEAAFAAAVDEGLSEVGKDHAARAPRPVIF